MDFWRQGVLAVAALISGVTLAATTATDGDWAAQNVTLTNTSEAAFMVRVGDIDNLGYGWPSNFDPFSGETTPVHAWPCTSGDADASGTDRIMVVSSYASNPPNGSDGYTSCTSRPANSPRPVILQWDKQATGSINAATLQIFVDDFQAPSWRASYQVLINGVRIPTLERLINSLDQTGPVGKLITFQIPSEYLYLLNNGRLSLLFDDPVTGAGDGYAIDFVKLLINPKISSAQTGTVSGKVLDSASGTALKGAAVTVNGEVLALTDASGAYSVTTVSAGYAAVQVSRTGYITAVKFVDVLASKNSSLDFSLVVGQTPTSSASNCVATLNNSASLLTIPCLDYLGVNDARTPYWAEFEGFVISGPLTFRLKNYGAGYKNP